ncbi:hypothetical protein ACN47E_000821 [Coniothyrium glycines]
MTSSPPASPAPASAGLRHPVPDLQSLQGAYVGNIERLEEHAERMSEPGSDLGEEIRKLHTELKRSDSRRSSLRSTAASDEPAHHVTTRSRNVSTSSHANSIVDLNGNARWGGYSPGGYVTSPVGSLRSRSGSTSSPSMQRQRSESKASRLGQIVRPEDVQDETERLAARLGSLTSPPIAPLSLRQHDSPPPSELRKVSSFTRIYDEIANELPEALRNSIILGQPPSHNQERPGGDGQYQRYAQAHDLPDRPPTAASTDTTHQARTLWQDFDGTHCPVTVIEEEPEPSHSGHSRQSSTHSSFMMRSNAEMPVGAPPPDENMVFYPAPVPRMLNLPKRLSQLPASSIQARRRTQLLESMQVENRKSAPLLGDLVGDEITKPRNRKSRQSLMALPPQLRASAYFDQAAPTQEFAVAGESAEDTLDNILDASARAPVSAFTDHPFTGQSSRDIFASEHKRQTSSLHQIPPTLEQARRRSSFNLLDTNNNSSGEPLNKLRKRNSSADMNLLIVKASESRMSLGAELDEHDEHARGPPDQNDDTSDRRSFDEEGRNPDDVYEEQAIEDGPGDHEEEQYFGAPTTLLAELQLRKAKQKTRTVNYATLVENGLVNDRRTLLQMDEMAEKEKQRRIKRKVQLAWEAQRDAEEDSDDDVPLGVLYHAGGANQRQEASRPLGLFEQREIEDNEPLSRRRNRLRGIQTNRLRDQSPDKRTASQMHLAVPITTTPGLESEEDEVETLGERMRRLKDKQMLEAALGDDVRKSTVSGDFAAEMLSKLGATGLDEQKPSQLQPAPSTVVVEEDEGEEETLGQRRARLQAEAAARDNAFPAAQHGLRSSTSLANLLAANPLHNANQARKVSNEMLVSHLPQGSLLQQNEVASERRKAQRLTQNMRASSHGTQLLPTAADKNDDDVPLAAKIQAYKNIMKGVSTPTASSTGAGAQMPMMNMNMVPDQRSSFMPGVMGMGMMGQPNFNMMQQQSMMMSMQSQMPTPFQYPQQHPGMGIRQSSNPMMMNGMGMQLPMNSMPMGLNNMNGMGMGAGMNMMMQPMDPRQRDQIDQWMQGIRH